MPSLTVQILFSGLIAYAPNSTSTNSVVLVLNDASSSSMPHQAYLSVPISSLVVKDESDFKFESDPTDLTGKASRTVIAGGFDLEIDGLSKGNAVFEECRWLKPREGKEDQKACLLKASELRADYHKPLEKFLNRNGPGLARALAVRFRADAGILRPNDGIATTGLNAREVKWEYPLSTPRGHYVPERMEWNSPTIDGEERVTLLLTPFGGGTPRRIVIRKGVSDLVVFSIYNVPAKEEVCKMGYGRYAANHLERLARLADEKLDPMDKKVKPKPFQVPTLTDINEMMRIDGSCGDGAGGLEPVICYGIQMP